MASSMLSSATVASVKGATPAQASMVAPFNGLKSNAAFPVTLKLNEDITSLSSNGGRVQCMQVCPPTNIKKFETLSYLPALSEASLVKEVDDKFVASNLRLIGNRWSSPKILYIEL